jgi:hypothetical protein
VYARRTATRGGPNRRSVRGVVPVAVLVATSAAVWHEVPTGRGRGPGRRHR